MELEYSYAKVSVEVMDVWRDEFTSYSEVAKVAWGKGKPIAFEFKKFYKGELIGSYIESPYDFVADYQQEINWYQTIEVTQELSKSEYQKEIGLLLEEEKRHYNKYLAEMMKPMTKEECNGVVTLDFVSKEIRKQEVQAFVDSLFEGI